MSSVADLLGAASLAFGALSIFYSLWSRELQDAIDAIVQPHRESRGPDIYKCKLLLKSRAWPLFLISNAISLILAPPAISIIYNVLQAFWNLGWNAFREYDAVSAMLVAIWVLFLFFDFLSFSLVRKLKIKLKKMLEK